MADKKITDLDAAGAAVDTDVIEIVQDVATTPKNYKLTWALIKSRFKTYFDTLYQEILSGASISTATVSASDKVLIQDADDSDNLKTVTAQSIADLGGGGGASYNYILCNYFCNVANAVTSRTYIDLGGSASIDTNRYTGLHLVTTNSASDYAKVYALHMEAAATMQVAIFDFDSAFSFCGMNVSTGSSNHQIACWVGAMTINASSITRTTAHYGYFQEEVSGAITHYLTCADGASESTATLTLAGNQYARAMVCLLDAGVSCKMYSNGVLKGTVSTNLPSGNSTSGYLATIGINNRGQANNTDWTISHVTLAIDLTS